MEGTHLNVIKTYMQAPILNNEMFKASFLRSGTAYIRQSTEDPSQIIQVKRKGCREGKANQKGRSKMVTVGRLCDSVHRIYKRCHQKI